MEILPRVTDVRYLGARSLRLTFSDGLVRDLDFDGQLPGVLSAIDNEQAFSEVRIDSVAGTVCWPSGIDLDPDVLHGGQTSSSGIRPRLLREHRLQPIS